jgi:hypothetical protein
MKKTILFLGILSASVTGYGQAYEGSVQFRDNRQPAAVIELPYPASFVNEAMSDHLSKKGKSQSSDIKGFTTFRNTQPIQSDSINADLYFKTERKSRKEKNITMVSLLIMPSEAQAGTGNTHYMNMDHAKLYLNELATAVTAYSLEQSIKDQNDLVAKAEAKYKSLVNDGDDLEKKREAIEKKIQDNKHDQQQQLKEIENEKQKLTNRVEQRKS